MNTDALTVYRDFLDHIKPDWLPTYDVRKFGRHFDAECGFGSDTMAAMYVLGREFEERLALLHIAAAFCPMYSRQREYREVHGYPLSALRNALERNSHSDVPTYSGLLDLLLTEGVIQAEKHWTSSEE